LGGSLCGVVEVGKVGQLAHLSHLHKKHLRAAGGSEELEKEKLTK